MADLITPFGRIAVLVDGKEIGYSEIQGKGIDALCPDIVGRYRILVDYIPDGNEHVIACILPDIKDYNKAIESGERLECQGFYNNERWKLSIGVECETGYYADGIRVSDEYDYDADYLDNGMAFLILRNTKTTAFEFGIAWIDDVGWDDDVNNEDDRDVQTWFAADPTIAL